MEYRRRQLLLVLELLGLRSRRLVPLHFGGVLGTCTAAWAAVRLIRDVYHFGLHELCCFYLHVLDEHVLAGLSIVSLEAEVVSF